MLSSSEPDAEPANDLQIRRQTVTLRELVEDKVRGMIASGLLKPGQRLIERELCSQLGVGRTSVREALRQLEAEGLVTTSPHRGPVVTTLTVDDAKHLYAVRAILEGYAGRMFAMRRDAKDIAALVAASKKLATAAKSRDQQALIKCKTTFYGVLLDGSGNPYVKQMLTIMHNRITVLRATSMMQPQRLESSLREIEAICDAVRRGDGPGAESACIAHIEAAAKVAIEVLQERENEEVKDVSS